MLLTLQNLEQAAEQNPYPEAKADPKTLHLNFLETEPEDPDMKTLKAIKKESDRFELKDKVFYLHAPDGIGRSKLARSAEKLLGVPMTGRNWRTVSKILEMAKI